MKTRRVPVRTATLFFGYVLLTVGYVMPFTEFRTPPPRKAYPYLEGRTAHIHIDWAYPPAPIEVLGSTAPLFVAVLIIGGIAVIRSRSALAGAALTFAGLVLTLVPIHSAALASQWSAMPGYGATIHPTVYTAVAGGGLVLFVGAETLTARRDRHIPSARTNQAPVRVT